MTIENNSPLNIQSEDISQFLYDKTVVCPVCEKESKNKAAKKSSYRPIKRDSDSMIHYEGVNPTFYEVIYCPECGYAALPLYFPTISPKGKDAILEHISAKWVKPSYPEYNDVNFAIKQLKLALHNAIVKDSLDSEKGLICLKISWLYRLTGDKENERRFQEQTVTCFEKAYMSENFPAAGMDEHTMQYMIGELLRLLGYHDRALAYFSKALISLDAPAKLKEKIRDQKNLIEKIKGNK